MIWKEGNEEGRKRRKQKGKKEKKKEKVRKIEKEGRGRKVLYITLFMLLKSKKFSLTL